MGNWEPDFINAVKRGGETRKRAYEIVERHYRDRFGNGEAGYKCYSDLLELVKKAGDEDAVTEYQERFVGLLDREYVGEMLLELLRRASDKKVAGVETYTKTKELAERLRDGGEEGIATFVKVAIDFYKARQASGLAEWTQAALPLLPKDDREILFATALEALVQKFG